MLRNQAWQSLSRKRMSIQTERQTSELTDRKARRESQNEQNKDRQTNKKTDRQAIWGAKRQTDTPTGSQIDK